MAKRSYQQEVPASRVNITYTKHIGDAVEKQELPLKFLVVGDFSHQEDETALEDRKLVSVNKNNFDNVMRSKKLKLNFKVDNLLDEKGAPIDVALGINGLNDFLPANIAKNVPALNQLLQVRRLLQDLKSRVVNNKQFRKQLAQLIGNDGKMRQLKRYLDSVAPIEESKPTSAVDPEADPNLKAPTS